MTQMSSPPMSLSRQHITPLTSPPFALAKRLTVRLDAVVIFYPRAHWTPTAVPFSLPHIKGQVINGRVKGIFTPAVYTLDPKHC